MTGKEFIEAMRAGRRLYGTMLASPSPEWPPMLAKIRPDWIFVDTEHAARNREMMSWMCRNYTAMGIPTVVRILSPDPYLACMVLDAGASGVLAPYIETVEQVKALAGAVKYRPVKGRKLDRILAGEKMDPVLEKYLAERNAGCSLLVNIESVDAMQNLDAILSVPELDGVVIGPHDLSCSLDIPEQYQHPKFLAAMEEIVVKARRYSKGAGIHFGYPAATPEVEAAFLKKGLNLFLHQTDHLSFQINMTRDLDALRKELGDPPPER